MQPFTTHTGRAVVLARSDVDTDQIIPSDFLKRVGRTGFVDGLFAEWRRDPAFVLNTPAAAGASVLLAGRNFGIGSSREHAVWALQEWGFVAVISPRFGDIFRTNALKGGLLPVQLPDATVEALMAAVGRDPAPTVTVDLLAREVRCAELTAAFDLDDYSRWRLLEGLDDIDLTLRHEPDIAAYEATRSSLLPSLHARASR